MPAFLFVYAGAVVIASIGAWAQAARFNLEAPLVALLAGLAISNLVGLPRQLDAGGAVCGVSASIAIAGAVRAAKEHAPTAITMVIVWAIVMIFFLPFASRLLGLPAGVAGAWIGTSEFADAAGFAAAQAYGGLAERLPDIEGTTNDAVGAGQCRR